MRSIPQSLPTSSELLKRMEPASGTRTVAGPVLVTRAAVRAFRLQITVVPGAKSMRPPLRTSTEPHTPG